MSREPITPFSSLSPMEVAIYSQDLVEATENALEMLIGQARVTGAMGISDVNPYRSAVLREAWEITRELRRQADAADKAARGE
jgi:uncharacterized protein YbjQ (UPF0145 family)